MAIELRASERLIWARLRYREAPELIHIKVGASKITNDLLHDGQYYDVTACGAKVWGSPATDLPAQANYATCDKCRKKYKPKRGQTGTLTSTR